MSEPALLVRREPPVARLVLNRPAVHNAFDDALIATLAEALVQLARDAEIRLLLLSGAGKSFSAGADLAWMRRMATFDEERNLADARRLEALLRSLDEFPKPTLALVQGAAMGGGVGLVAACDIAIAQEDAFFALSEVRLGLVPAVVGPYVVRAIGGRACRRLFLTGERIPAWQAQSLGLVHEVVEAGALEDRAAGLVSNLLAGGPQAQAEAKRLIRLAREGSGGLLPEATARSIARRRASPEAAEGMASFLAKRPPAWRG